MFYKLALFFFIDLKRHKSTKSENGDFNEVFVICQAKSWAISLQIHNYSLQRSF